METVECGDPQDAMGIESEIANQGKYRAFSHVVAPPGHPRQVPNRDVAIAGLCERSGLRTATAHRLQSTPTLRESR
jgi:hypothetical protein